MLKILLGFVLIGIISAEILKRRSYGIEEDWSLWDDMISSEDFSKMATYLDDGYDKPMMAPIKSKRYHSVMPIQDDSHDSKPKVIKIKPYKHPFHLVYNTGSSPIKVEQRHKSSPGHTEATRTEDEPHHLKHEVFKPVIQEITEIIQPYRTIKQEIRPVQENVKTIVHKNDGDDNHKSYSEDNKEERREYGSDQNDYKERDHRRDDNRDRNYQKEENEGSDRKEYRRDRDDDRERHYRRDRDDDRERHYRRDDSQRSNKDRQQKKERDEELYEMIEKVKSERNQNYKSEDHSLKETSDEKEETDFSKKLSQGMNIYKQFYAHGPKRLTPDDYDKQHSSDDSNKRQSEKKSNYNTMERREDNHKSQREPNRESYRESNKESNKESNRESKRESNRKIKYQSDDDSNDWNEFHRRKGVSTQELTSVLEQMKSVMSGDQTKPPYQSQRLTDTITPLLNLHPTKVDIHKRRGPQVLENNEKKDYEPTFVVV